MSRVVQFRETFAVGADETVTTATANALHSMSMRYRGLSVEKCWTWVNTSGVTLIAVRMIGVI